MNLYDRRLLSIEKIISRLNDRIAFLNKRNNKFSFYRLMVFIAGVLLSTAAFLMSKETGWVVSLVSLMAFGITVHLHNKLLFGIKRCHTYLKIKEANLARMNVEWEKIPKPVVNTLSGDEFTEKDLDLFGENSLHHLSDTSVSIEGSLLLRKWISNFTPDASEIINRQQIVKELSGFSLFRDKFILKANLISKKFLECSKILEWITSSSTEALPKWLFPAAGLLIVCYVILFILGTIGTTGSLWLAVLIAYFFIYSMHQKKINKLFEDAVELETHLKKFTALILYIDKFSFEKKPALKEFMSVFKNENNRAANQLRKLQKVISALLVRENPVIRIIVNIVFPYDIFYSNKLVEIKSEIEKNIPQWLSRFNELECYISLSNFSYLNPDYVYPVFETSTRNIFETKGIAHPLLKRRAKISNDFAFKNKNEIGIITGSNMSGKSTFLRTVGVNLCLAYSGAPVNAEYLKTSLFELFTCIKVTDSVIDGISYFYAEVRRLKQLLDEFDNNNGLEKFFLIDEIFKGTNNKERLTGSRAYIKKLAQLDATGFVTTHDLELVNLEKEIPDITNYHFREEVKDGLMLFDYRIHNGPCPTTNALKIIELAGLPVE